MQITIILCVACIFALFYSLFQTKKQLSAALQFKAEKIADSTAARRELEELQKKISDTKIKYLKETSDYAKELDTRKQELINQYNADLENYKQTVQEAAANYIDTLESTYSEAEDSFNEDMASIVQEKETLQESLNSLKATRQAAYDAYIKEKQIQANKQDYCLIPDNEELDDIKVLNRLKKELHKPRILSMLIWQTYFQTLAKKQFPIIIGGDGVTGIYKITNQETGECYIGQAKDIYKRWCEHCKCGLGIDTPPGNKLYKAMQDYGLENFSFEVIEICKSAELNEKEHYYIGLYNADMFYNSNKGISK